MSKQIPEILGKNGAQRCLTSKNGVSGGLIITAHKSPYLF